MHTMTFATSEMGTGLEVYTQVFKVQSTEQLSAVGLVEKIHEGAKTYFIDNPDHFADHPMNIGDLLDLQPEIGEYLKKAGILSIEQITVEETIDLSRTNLDEYDVWPDGRPEE